MTAESTPPPLKFGVLLSAIDADIADASRRIEDQGWDFLTSGEHVSFNVPIANAFVSLAAAAAATSTIELMSAVTLLPLYPAVLAAKLGAALDNVSNGRFVLGVGVGGENPREFAACGVPVKERGARTDEALDIIRRLWTGDAVTYSGRWAELDDVSIRPAPVRRPNPPIWVAGRRDAAMRRAARFGDGWMPYMYTAQMLVDSIDTIAAQRAAQPPIESGVYLWSCVHEDSSVAVEHALQTLTRTYRQDFSAKIDKYLVVGDPAHCVERVLEYVRAGATRVIFANACPPHYVDRHVELLATQVVPAVRAALGASVPKGVVAVPEPQQSATLAGLTVLDFSTMIAGPYCTRLFADLGADVIKIESPDGDHMRKLRPRKSGCSRFFGQLNVGKRSATADLTSTEQRRDVLRLVAEADAVIENWRPGVAARLGLGYEDCRAVRPDIVFCSISGWGQTGPSSARAAFAPNVHAASGVDMANLRYQAAGSVPPVTGVFVGDVLGGTMAFGAVLAALRRRDLTGAGSNVDVSLVESMLSMPIYELQAELAGLTERRPSHRPVPTSDGFIILTIVNDQNWRAVATAIGRPELGTDPRYVDVRARTGNWDEIHGLVCAWAISRTAASAEAQLLAHGVPAAQYQTMAAMLTDEHLRERRTFLPAVDAAGEFTVPATPFRFDGQVTPAPRSAVPELGADSASLFACPSGNGQADPAARRPAAGPEQR